MENLEGVTPYGMAQRFDQTTKVIDWFKETLVKQGTISSTDLELVQIIDDPKDVVEAIFKHYEYRGFEPSAEETEKMLHL